MIRYLLRTRFADPSIKLDDKILAIISDCAKCASKSIASIREKRSYEVVGRDDSDPDTFFLLLTSREAVNPTRSLSAVSRQVIQNEYMSSILLGHTPNGNVFKATIETTDENAAITYKNDTEIASEVISIFFDNNLPPKEKNLARDTAEKIREIVIQYLNDKNTL